MRKPLSDNYLLVAYIVVIAIWVLACSIGCTPEVILSSEKVRSHTVKYKAALSGNSIIYFRSADNKPFQIVGKIPSGLNTTDTTWSETKTTIEKW